MRKTEQDLLEGRKCAPWKAKLAYAVKSQTSVTDRWLGERLHRGTVTTVSDALVAYKRELCAVQNVHCILQ
ncbi:MAG: hypothetical protein SFY80_10670 [Verrucomicrobiota bacterium]|nr:hypothetical protein [Verrucomicrobiota bacterium]